MRRITGFIALFALGLSTPAMAAPKDEARRHFSDGLELIADGDYLAGIAEFKLAYDKVPHPAVLYNIARAYADAQDYESAIEYFELYLATEPIDRGQVESDIRTMRSRLGERRPPTPDEGSTSPSLGGTATADELAELQRHARELSELADRLAERELQAVAQTEGGEAEPPPDGGETVDSGEPLELEGGLVEDLFQRVVVTASRFGQDPLESPSAITVITQDEIKLSAAATLPEVLALAPGVDVMQLTAGTPEVSIRGFNRRLANKVLVLVDGRTVYLDFIGNVQWSGLPISMAEIDRIEIIRGPGSAIYGADAFAGVINIITKTPGDPTHGNQVSVRAGTQNFAGGDVVVNGRNQQVAYRAGASYQRIGRWSQDADPDRPDIATDVEDQATSASSVAANAQLDWRFGKRGLMSVSGGFTDGTTEFYSLGGLRLFWIDRTTTYARADAAVGPVYLRTFYNRFRGEAQNWYYPEGGVNLQGDIASDSVDVELSGDQAFGKDEQHRLTAGLGYRYKTVQWDFLTGAKPESHFNGYIQEQSRFGPVTLAGALRVDRHPIESIGINPSGRLAVITQVGEGRAVRVNAGNAFRQPTFLETYADVNLSTGPNGILANTRGVPDQIDIERVLTLEAGYMDHSLDVLRAEATAYAYKVDDLIYLTSLDFNTQDDGFSEDDGAYIAGEAYFANEPATFYAFGGEIAAEYFGIPGLDIGANYAFERIVEVAETEGSDPDPGEETKGYSNAHPQHKLNTTVAYRSPWDVDLGMQVSYVSGQTWGLRGFDAAGVIVSTDKTVDPYVVLSNRVVWRPPGIEELDLSVSAWNWLASISDTHQEHPLGQPVGARYSGSVTYRF